MIKNFLYICSIKFKTMKKILFVVFMMVSFISISQEIVTIKNPWFAKSNNEVTEFFLKRFSDKYDSIFYRLFDAVGISTDSITWAYQTTLIDTITKKGQDYYSLNYYITSDKTDDVECREEFKSQNKLGKKLYFLDYTSVQKDGTMYFILQEYY